MANDNFSRQAGNYARYRPGYPGTLFKFILGNVKEWRTAWDCATGNGQTAIMLAGFFERVFATDISQQQLDHAYHAPNIFYSRQPAEQTDFPNDSFDLITVSQALHWLKFEKFYAEVNRVARPQGWIAAWVYSLVRISPPVDSIIEKFHYSILGDFWDPEREYVNNKYLTIPFPFREIETPDFAMEYEWTIEQLGGYLNTWSALQKFISVNNNNPVENILEEIKPYWITQQKKVVFPVHLRMGQVHK